MAKAVAVHAVVVVALIGMLMFFALVIFWQWMKWNEIQTSKAVCSIKYANCCLQLNEDKTCDWANTPPKECEKFDILEPTSKDQCKI